jgi:hypothetical protein
MAAPGEPASQGLHTGTRLPDFFIVGQPKSGTTALYHMLRRHPQIYMSEIKEPLFFASDLRPDAQGRATAPERRSARPSTYQEYLALFDAATPEQRVGEASSSYLRSQVAAGAIAHAQPSARILAILREPASFLRSLHLQRLQEHVESEPDLAVALSLEERRRQGHKAHARDRPQMLLYSDFVHYVEQLRRFHAVFPPEQMMVLIYDDFRQDNERIVREVLRFLDVDDTAPLEVIEANPTVAVRSARLDLIAGRLQLGQGAVGARAHTLVKALTPQSVRRRALRLLRERVLYGDPPPVDERVMTDLHRRFRPEVVALSEYLKRDLVTLWGYQELV